MVLVLLVGVLGFLQAVASQTQAQGYDQSYQRGYQQQQQPLPAIVMHKQALGTDGSFNYAFSADNGLQQGETISPDGSRTGSYSYVDPTGKTVSVKYSAGKDGFRILEGDHVPRAPQPQPQQGGGYYQQGAPALYHRAPVQHARPQYAGIRAELNAIGSQGYAVQEDHGQGAGQPRVPSLYEPQVGPATYPPVPRQRAAAAGSYFRPANQQPEDHGPHTFGNGYSFEFAG